MKTCELEGCSNTFPLAGAKKYCSPGCTKEALKLKGRILKRKMKENRICQRCRNPLAESDGVYCESCNVKVNARHSKYRADRKASNKCSNAHCPNEASPNRTKCEECGKKASEEANEKHAARKAKGQCVKCRNPAEPNLTRCQSCSNKANAQSRQTRQGLYHKNLCVLECGEARLPDKRYCEGCLSRMKIATEKCIKKGWIMASVSDAVCIFSRQENCIAKLV